MAQPFLEENCGGELPDNEMLQSKSASRTKDKFQRNVKNSLYPGITPGPSWLRKKATHSHTVESTRELLTGLNLHTVCQGARCPNLTECFARKTATFLILGERCTRRCNFCAVTKGIPELPDPSEPARIAEAAARLGLRYVVITSVTRDDLPDGGSGHFARTIREVRHAVPGMKVEALVPDFQGDMAALAVTLAARPDVLNHNIETVPRLYPLVRPQADYRRSLNLLREAKKLEDKIWTKSGLMVGLGENPEEVVAVMRDLRAEGCAILTIGQYLQPSPAHLTVQEFIPPEVFQKYREQGLALGFREVVAGPWVRSSYHAGEVFTGLH